MSVSNINITSKNTGKISVSVKPTTPLTISPKAQTSVSIKGVVGATHDLTGTDFGLLYKDGENKVSTSVVTYNANTQLVTFPSGISPLSIYDQNDSRGTSGQVLSSTGTALDWINLSEISGVDGTGTANYLAKWTDGDTITDSTIYDNGTNVGIGTATPSRNLEVSSSGTTTLRIGSTNSFGRGIELYTTGSSTFLDVEGTFSIRKSDSTPLWTAQGGLTIANQYFYGGYINFRKRDTTTNLAQIGLENGSNTYFNTGNFGIGTTAPSEKLHVVGNSKIEGTLTIENTKIQDVNGQVYFDNLTNGGDIFIRTRDDQGGVDTGILINGTDKTVSLRYNTLERLKTSLDGIDVTGNINLGSGGYLKSSTRTNILLDRPSDARMVFNTLYQSSTTGGYDFTTGSTSRMVITGDGNVGIGTTSPAAKLHVNGGFVSGASTTSGLYFNPANDRLYISNQTVLEKSGASLFLGYNTNQLIFRTNNLERARFDVNGNFGIGTTAPSEKLHVLGKTIIQAPNGSNTVLELRNPVNNDRGIRIVGSATGSGASAKFYVEGFGAGGVLESKIDWSPANNLTYNLGYASRVWHTTYTQNVKGRNNTSEGELNLRSGTTSSPLTFGINTTEYMRVHSNGNVGIGTTSPLEQLQIHDSSGGNITISGNTSTAGVTFGTIDFYTYTAGQGVGAKITATKGSNWVSGNLLFHTGENNSTSPRMIITSTGNVGIGTTTPAHALHINKDNPYIQIQDSSASSRAQMNSGIIMKDSTGAQSFGITHSSSADVNIRANAGDLSLGTFSGTVIKLDGSNVGIGTTTPSHKLHVKNGSNDLLLTRDTGTAVRIGIGSSNPSYAIELGAYSDNAIGGIKYLRFYNGTDRLDVNGNGRFGFRASKGYYFYPTTDSPSGDSYGVAIRHLRDSSIGLNDNILLVQQSDGTDVFAVKGNGETQVLGDLSVTGSTTFESDLTVNGDFTVNGTTTTINSTTLTVDDKNIVLAQGAADSAAADGAGITIDGADATLTYTNVGTNFVFNKNVNIDRGASSAFSRVIGNLAAVRIRRTSYTEGSAGLDLMVDSTNNHKIATLSSVDLQFHTNDTERLRITSTGNVGIGSTIPSEKLHVGGNIIATGGTITAFASNTSKAIINNVSGGGRLQLLSEDGSIELKSRGGDSYFNAGNVGIGTTAPTEKLDVSGNLNVSGFIFGGNEIRVGSGNWLRFGSKPTLWADATNVTLRGGSGNDALTYESSSGAEQLRITNDGKVGIGTTAPSGRLHVSSTTGWGAIFERGIKDGNTSSYSHNYGAGNAHILGRPVYFEGVVVFSTLTADSTTKEYRFINSSDKLQVQSVVAGVTTQSDILVLDGSNVGIGTDSPTVPLHVNGDLLVNNEIRFVDTAMRIFRSGDDMRLRTNNSDRMTITSTGNVGIGKTNPSYKLDITGTMRIEGGDFSVDGSRSIYFGPSGAQGRLRMSSNFASYSDTGFNWYTDGELSTPSMVLDSAGNVGIGTTAPSEKLHVDGKLRLDGGVYSGNLNYLEFNPSSSDSVIAQKGGGNYLMLRGNNGVKLLRNSGTSVNVVLGEDAQKIVASGTNDSIAFVTASTEKFRINSAGNVGIGTTSPTHKLEVRGTAVSDAISSNVGFNVKTVVNPDTTNTTVTLASGTELTVGTVYYNITYYNALGQTARGSYKTIAITSGNQRVQLDNIPISPDETVIGRKIYRSKVGESPSYGALVATIADNTTTSYLDTLPETDSAFSGHIFSRSLYALSNTTANWISTNDVRSLVVDPNLTTLGVNAGTSITRAGNSTLIGYEAGKNITYGSGNTLVGARAGQNITTGYQNTLLGDASGSAITTGSYNIALGPNTLHNSAGDHNIAMGYYTAKSLSGNRNVLLGGYIADGTAVSFNESVIIGVSASATTGVNGQVNINNLIFGNKNTQKVGIGTSDPRESLEITKYGVSANIRLNQSGGSIGSGEVIGSIQFSAEDVQVPTDQQVGASISAISENAWGSNSDATTALTFNTRKRELDAPIERMRVTNTGNVGVGTSAPDASAILDLDSTTQGVLFPRMTEANRTSIGSPATGLIVYQTDGDEGLYIYKSTGWIQII